LFTTPPGFGWRQDFVGASLDGESIRRSVNGHEHLDPGRFSSHPAPAAGGVCHPADGCHHGDDLLIASGNKKAPGEGRFFDI
jgi:hypothetical protein